MTLSGNERETVHRIVYEEKSITTDLKPETLEQKIETIRPLLYQVANENETTGYWDITDGFSRVHFSRIGTILGVIGLLEHENGNPPLPAVVINKQEGWPGGGFLGLLDMIGEPIPDSEEKQRELWRKHLAEVHRHDW